MPLDKSKSKDAFSRNVSAEMNAGKPQKQALAIAFRVQRDAKAAGGGIRIGGKKVPYQIGGNSSKKPWKGYKSGGIVRKAEGGEVDWSKLNQPLGEIKGTAPEDTPVAYKTPNLNITEGDIDRSMNVGMGSGPGIMVGKYGALALRNAAHEAGQAMKPHPVYAAEDVAATKALRPEMRDAVMNWRQDARDAAGQQALESRAPTDTDRDIWKATGWHRGMEGAAKKEIPDIGAKLVPVPGDKTGNAFRLEHPAGDLHKVYDIPPIKFDPLMREGTAYATPGTREIVIGGSNVKGATSTALHEIQHLIQHAEGFGMGSNPRAAAAIGPIETELFPGHVPSWWQGKDAGGTGKGPDELYARMAPHKGAAFNTYERAAGEVESRNVQDRRTKSFRYQSHPEDTESVTRGLQWVPDFERLQRMIKGGEENASSKFTGYHGTSHDFDTFKPNIPKTITGREDVNGVYFSGDPNTAYNYASRSARQTGSGKRRVIEAELAMDNPLDITGSIKKFQKKGMSFGDAKAEALKSVTKDHDGVVFKGNAINPPEYIMFDPSKITRKADGGSLSSPPWFVRNEARAPSGMLKSSIPGRTDKIPVSVAGGSYVLPADIPSALGQGNTVAGGSILDKMFTKGPYGMNVMKTKAGNSTKMARMSSLTKTRKSGYAEGGETPEPTPIIAAGGEYILDPEQVAHLGGGNVDAGHKILDQFVLSVRKQHINTLKNLKPPKKD